MKRLQSRNSLTAAALALAMFVVPIASIGQTRVSMPKNKYKVQDDIKIGNEASREVEKEFPLINDGTSQQYVSRIGERLVAAIPAQFQHPEFDYRFQVVNASDINAFALPGGPMYVNRGMIEAAKNEGEMAGVMAHEISHVALRHATAQQTKLNNPLNQILGIGAILGGAILGGQSGAQLGQVFAAGYFLKYSREYETQADTLGAQIMANAGYDPRDLANMFRTIQQQSGGRGGPEWLSSHPDPGNRYQNINKEAGLLRINGTPIKITREFQRTQERLRSMPRARSMQEIQAAYKNGRSTAESPTMGGTYSASVALPSTRTRIYSSGNWIQMSVPSNWREFSGDSSIQFAPEGGYGNNGITHGAMIGIVRSNTRDVDQATRDYVDGLLQNNSYLRQRSNYTRTTLDGREGYTTALAGRSTVTGKTEVVTIYTTMLRNGDLFYAATVAPDDEAYDYSRAFRNMLASIRLND